MKERINTNVNQIKTTGTEWFKNLTGLRFIAAALVIIDHTEQARDLFGYKNIWKLSGVYALGDKAVTLFFVLSGFLITYLLLKEKRKTQTISIKDFYIRRILRIWPLYYLIVVLALFILPQFSFFQWPQWSEYLQYDFGKKCLLFLLILPNVNQVIYPAIPFGNQLWSIGVEEQFYLFWPLIIKFIKPCVIFLLCIVIGMPIIISGLYFISNHNFQLNNSLLNTINFLKQFLSLTRIDCMAIGGLAAYSLFEQKKKILDFIYKPIVQIINLIILLFILATGFYLPVVSNMLHGIVFSILILNLAANPQSLINLEWQPLNYLGKISYGIYMYHPLCIFLSIKLLMSFHLNIDSISVWVLLYFVVYAFSILLASVSYKLLELPLLKLKPLFNRNVISLKRQVQ
jgi:peptidoglycan/LPS O-acetylase OafA/YrhL